MARYSTIVTTQPDSPLIPPVPIVGASVYVLKPDGTPETLSHDDGSNYTQPAISGFNGLLEFNVPDPGNVYDLQYRYAGRLIREDQVIIGNPPQYKGDTGGNVMSIGSFQTASPGTMVIPSGAGLVQTSEFTTGSKVGAALYVKDDTLVTSTYVTANPLTSFRATDETGSVHGFRLYPGQEWQLEMVGGRADGTSVVPYTSWTGTDNLPALLALALAGTRPFVSFPATSFPAITVRMAEGGYYFSALWEMHGVFQFKGSGGEQDYMGYPRGTVWMYPRLTGGVIAQSYNTTGRSGVNPSSTLGGSRGSTFEGISFLGVGPTTALSMSDILSGVGSAVQMRTPITLRLCRYYNVAGNHEHIVGYTDGTPGQPYGEVNSWVSEGCYGHSYAGYGQYIMGSDVNAGRSIGFQGHQGGLGCIFNRSYYANFFAPGDLAGYGASGVWYAGYNYVLLIPQGGLDVTPGTNRYVWRTIGPAPDPGPGAIGRFPRWGEDGKGGTATTYYFSGPLYDGGSGSGFIVPYSELSTGFCNVQWPSVLIGGSNAATGSVWQPSPVYGGALGSERGFIGRRRVSPSETVEYDRLGADAVDAYGVYDNTDRWLNRATYCNAAGGSNVWSEYFATGNYYRTFGTTIISWRTGTGQGNATASANVAAKAGRTAQVLNTEAFPRIMLGSGDGTDGNHRVIQYDTATPTTGEATAGELRPMLAPSATSPVALRVCYVAGTPGTWAAVASITRKNTTANRPTLTANDVGVLYLDSTLNANGKPIWWTGTAWVDATGATV